MNKIVIGIIAGVIAGIIDIIPMMLQKLSWDANISAFAMWIICGFLIATTNIKIHPILKGLLISFLVLTPSAILIGWKEPFSLIPISVMTIILGSLLGFILGKIKDR